MITGTVEEDWVEHSKLGVEYCTEKVCKKNLHGREKVLYVDGKRLNLPFAS